jgi:hypothetical protein
MKQPLLFFLFIFSASVFLGQQVVPMSKTDDLYNKHLLRYKINNLKAKKDILSETEVTESSTLRRELDSLEEKVFIYGFGSSDAVSQGNITANGGFSFGAQMHPWDRFFLSIGIGGTVVKKEKQDSVNINSIFFPDNASSVVYGHYEVSISSICHFYKYKKKTPTINDNFSDDFIAYCEGSFQNRNIEARDSTITNFGIYNLSAGLKYRWTYIPNPKNKFCFDMGLAFGYIEIAKQSEKDFKSLVDPDIKTQQKVPTIYRGLNYIASIQYNDLIIYARIFNQLSVNGQLSDEHKIYFSTGIKVTGNLFSF